MNRQQLIEEFFKKMDEIVNKKYGENIHCHTFYNMFDECYTTEWNHDIGKEKDNIIHAFVVGFGKAFTIIEEINGKF